MKRLAVEVSDVVKDQIRAQVMFIAQHSVGNALAWEDQLRAAINHIGDLPEGYAVDRDAGRRIGETIRKMVFEKTYLIHYRINDSAGVVEVLNFRHASRRPKAGEP